MIMPVKVFPQACSIYSNNACCS